MPQTTMDAFRHRNSRHGLMLRYCRARIREFAQRQVLTLFGSATIAVGISPRLGLLTAALVLAGEAIDLRILRRFVDRWSAPGWVPASVHRQIIASAAIQSLTVVAVIGLAWFSAPGSDAGTFATVFLMAAVIDAGMILSFAPAVARAKMAILCVLALVILLQQIQTAEMRKVFVLLTSAILCIIAMQVIRTVQRWREKSFAYERALYDEQLALQQSRRALADEIRRAERLALVARHGNDSVIFTRPNGRIDWVNPAFERLTGYSQDEVIGETPEFLNAETTSAEALETLRNARQTLTPCVVEIENRTRDGRRLWMEVSMTPVLKADGSPDVFIAVERDITATVLREQELREAKLVAEDAARAKAAFLATMSHEIRTPMTGVIGVAEVLAETQLDPQQRKYVGTITESARALLSMINDILDLSRLQSGKVELRDEDGSLAEVLESCADLMRPIAQKKGLILTIEATGARRIRHRFDPGRIRQIVLNLMGNAVKFTSDGGVTARVSILPSPDGDQVRLDITDTGIGIAPERLTQVFESFTQADSSIGRRFGGTGLGLTISRLLAQEMGGDITVASILGLGSTFTLALRLPRAAEAPASPGPPPRTIPSQGRLRVLVADDNRTNQMVTNKFLAGAVATIEQAMNGAIAVEMWRDRHPDLVLMDVSMPVMDGLAATAEIRRMERLGGLRPCHIVALTAFSQGDAEADCRKAGVDEILTKPLARRALLDLIARVEADRFDETPAFVLDKSQRERENGRHRNAGP